MPYRTRSYADEALRITVLTGVLTEAEILEEYGRLLASPEFDPTHRELVDLTDVERLDISVTGVGKAVSMARPFDRAGIANRQAIVAPTDISYGISRMYQLMRHDSPGETEIFRDLDTACRWLGVDPVAVRPRVEGLRA
jgi:hypothetical protein